MAPDTHLFITIFTFFSPDFPETLIAKFPQTTVNFQSPFNSINTMSTDPKSPMNLNIEGLTLEEEGMTLNLENTDATVTILEHCLIGGVPTDKEVRFAYLSERLANLWQPVRWVTILPAAEGRFLFQFNHRFDATNVLKDGPWLYDNCNLVVDRIFPGMVPTEVALNHLDIWVQVQNLPFGFIQPRVAHAISW
jgi:hypothetical protein